MSFLFGQKKPSTPTKKPPKEELDTHIDNYGITQSNDFSVKDRPIYVPFLKGINELIHNPDSKLTLESVEEKMKDYIITDGRSEDEDEKKKKNMDMLIFLNTVSSDIDTRYKDEDEGKKKIFEIIISPLVDLFRNIKVPDEHKEQQAKILRNLDEMIKSNINLPLAGGVLKKQREKYKRTNFKKKLGNNRKTRSIKKASKRYLLSKYLNKVPKQKRKSSLRHKKCKKKV